MSTPMYDPPEHLWMGVNAEGQGPVATNEDAARWVCWCGVPGCDKPEGIQPSEPEHDGFDHCPSCQAAHQAKEARDG